MKRAMYVLLAACSLVSVAGELKQPATPPEPIAGEFATPPLPEGLQLRDSRRFPVATPAAPVLRFTARASGSCYFIKTVRPVPADANAPRSGFILLQARTSGFVRDPVCTGGAALMRAIPVAREIAAVAGDDSRWTS